MDNQIYDEAFTEFTVKHEKPLNIDPVVASRTNQKEAKGKF